jgi:hypothetical protein
MSLDEKIQTIEEIQSSQASNTRGNSLPRIINVQIAES